MKYERIRIDGGSVHKDAARILAYTGYKNNGEMDYERLRLTEGDKSSVRFIFEMGYVALCDVMRRYLTGQSGAADGDAENVTVLDDDGCTFTLALPDNFDIDKIVLLRDKIYAYCLHNLVGGWMKICGKNEDAESYGVLALTDENAITEVLNERKRPSIKAKAALEAVAQGPPSHCHCKRAIRRGRDHVVLRFPMSEITSDVRLMSHIISDTLGDKEPQIRAHLRDICEGANSDYVRRVVDGGFATMNEVMHIHTRNGVKAGWSSADDVIEDLEVYVIELRVDRSWFSESTSRELVHLIHDYIVSNVMWEWLRLVSPPHSIQWQEKKRMCMERVISVFRHRIRK